MTEECDCLTFPRGVMNDECSIKSEQKLHKQTKNYRKYDSMDTHLKTEVLAYSSYQMVNAKV